LHLGVISGSERTATFESGYLDRDTYENSNLRSKFKFAGHLSRIYDIFLSYRRAEDGIGRRQCSREVGQFSSSVMSTTTSFPHAIYHIVVAGGGFKSQRLSCGYTDKGETCVTVFPPSVDDKKVNSDMPCAAAAH
jgi:hypothetical protein